MYTQEYGRHAFVHGSAHTTVIIVAALIMLCTKRYIDITHTCTHAGMHIHLSLVVKIESRFSGSRILKCARIHFGIVSGGGSPNQNEVGGPNKLPLEREPHLESRPDPFLHRFRGGSPNQHDVGGQNIILLELEPHLERRPDQFWRCFVGGWGGGAPNKNEIHGQHRLPLQRQPHFERCPDPFLHRFRGGGAPNVRVYLYTCT